MRYLARTISAVFHPLLLATWLVLLFGTMNKYAFGAQPVNKMAVVIFFNTFFFPAFFIVLCYFLGFIPDLKLAKKEDRIIPLIGTQICLIWSFMVVKQLQMPLFLQLFILGATISTAMTFVANVFSKVSIHMVGMGAIIMLLMTVVFSGALDVGNFIPVAVLLAGIVGSSRMLEMEHTLGQLYYGLLIGILGQMLGLIAFNRMGIIGL